MQKYYNTLLKIIMNGSIVFGISAWGTGSIFMLYAQMWYKGIETSANGSSTALLAIAAGIFAAYSLWLFGYHVAKAIEK